MKRRRDRRASLSFTHRTCRTSVMSESTFDPYPNLLPGQGEGLKVANVDPDARSRSLTVSAFYFRAKRRVQPTRGYLREVPSSATHKLEQSEFTLRPRPKA